MASKKLSGNPEHQKGVAGADQVNQRVDKALEQGYDGIETDPTPNEHYSVGGVVKNKPTPETDEDTAKAAREARG